MAKSIITKEERIEIKHNNFLLRVEDTFPNEYTVLGKFINVGTRVLIKHNICDYEWNVFPSNLFSGQSKCPRCSDKVPHTTESFKKFVTEFTNGEFEITGEYVMAKVRIPIKHLKCNYEWEIFPTHIKKYGGGCPRCSKRERYTTEGFNDKLNEITNGEYTTSDKYINNRTVMKFQHLICNKVFNETPTAILYTYCGCPHCNDSLSKGERKIYDYLSSKRIIFNQQQTFPDCVDINALRFDFSILDEAKSIKGVIEFDGKQHFEPIEWFGGIESFQKQQRRDQIKNEYCKTNSIPLLRIPYWEESNINNILDEFISKLK